MTAIRKEQMTRVAAVGNVILPLATILNYFVSGNALGVKSLQGQSGHVLRSTAEPNPWYGNHEQQMKQVR